MKKKYVIILSLMMLTSCNLLKSTYYNELSTEEKKQYKIPDINSELHTQQLKGVFSINSEELLDLMNTKNDSVTIIIFERIFCPVHHEICERIVHDLREYKSKIMIISADDWVYKYEYQKLIDTSENINTKVYLLDSQKYGDIEGWHENKTYFKRLGTFYSEIKRLNNFELSSDNIYSLPIIMVFNRDKVIYEVDPFNCTDTTDCLKKYYNLIKYIDTL